MKSMFKFILTLLIVVLAVPLLSNKDVLVQTTFSLFLLTALLGMIMPVQFIKESGTLNMGLDVNIWKRYIIEKFRKTNSFIFKSKDDSGYVLGGAVVYIPQAGADPTVEVNSNSYPGVAVRRTDSDVNYALDSYRTVPTHIPFVELQTISYDKIDSVLSGHTNTLGEAVADNILIKWAQEAADFIVKTTGADIAPVAGQTGNRKGFLPADLKKAMIKMNLGNVPKAGRLALLDDQMFEFFYDNLTQQQSNAFNQFANEREGVVGRLHSFDIMTRSSVLAYAAADTVKAFGAALDADDNLASLCWHPDTVCRAFGDMKPFQDKDNPLYYGDIYSMLVRGGGRKERADNKGVVAIIQAAA